MSKISEKRLDYRIEGLDCAEEVAALRKTVGALPGVSRLDFDILNAKMRVELDPEVTTEQDVHSAVRRAGLRAFPWKPTCDSPVCPVEESAWRRHGRLVMCAASGVLLLAAAITHALLAGNFVSSLLPAAGTESHAVPLAPLLLYLVAVFTGIWYVAPKAWLSLKNLRPDMNLLMVIAVVGAAFIGQWLEAATVTFLFALALLLESWSVGRARRAISALMELAPLTARCIGADGAVEVKQVEQVKPGTTVEVRPGERVPLDGVVVRGTTTINQAPITGESAPVPKAAGSEVFAGTINNEGAFEFDVTKAAYNTTLARIIRLVEDAQSRRAASEQWVEKFARYYTPTVVALAVLVAIIPPLAFNALWVTWLYQALVLLVIACPCALVIATPVSIVAGLTSAARAGVLIKGGAYLEAPAHLRVVAFDKTGTLTYGQPEVQQIVPLNGHTAAELLARAAALETHSAHPLAVAIVQRAETEGVTPLRAEEFHAIEGKGAEALIDGRPFWIGSHRFMHEKGGETPQFHNMALQLEGAGHSVVAVGNDRHVCGLISVSDGVRDQAHEAISGLKAAGIRQVVMLTGDHEQTAQVVADQTGIDEHHANLLPEDKVAAVEKLVEKHGQVAMVGDGVNDAPAMAVSTLGIAMGAAGTDAAIETADIALMSDDLMKLPWLVRHSRATLRTIKQNIWFALAVKAVFMALAVTGLATLWMAIAADTGVSLLVIFNSLRLLKRRVS